LVSEYKRINKKKQKKNKWLQIQNILLKIKGSGMQLEDLAKN